MQKLDYWRCSHCSVILAENVIVPDRGTMSADCWKCGERSMLGERSTIETRVIDAVSVDRVAASITLGARYSDPADEAVIVHPSVSEVATDILLIDDQGKPSGVKTILSKRKARNQ